MPAAKKTTVKKEAVKKAPVKAEVKAPKAEGLSVQVFDLTGKSAGKVELPKEIFGVKVNEGLISQAVRVYLANRRRGTVSTKSRGEVKISTKKIYRQKGTGRARHGAKSAPIFVGGGVAFGPKPRDYSLKLSQKMKKVALFSALSSKLKDGEIKVLSGLEKVEPKTKNMEKTFESLELNAKGRNVLLVTVKGMDNAGKAGRNLKGVRILNANLLNTYDVLNNKGIVLAKESIEALRETFLKEK